MLSDVSLAKELAAGRIVIDPYPHPTRMQSVSVDLTLGDTYRWYPTARPVWLRDIPTGLTAAGHLPEQGRFVEPGEFLLLSTAEAITLPDDIVGVLEGKSTMGRLGLKVHSTAGLIDPGFSGHITLEVTNEGPLSIGILPGDPIAQLTFAYTTTPCARPYGSEGLGSHYQGQRGATEPAGVRP